MKTAPVKQNEYERLADPEFEEELDMMEEYDEKFFRKESKKNQVPKRHNKPDFERD